MLNFVLVPIPREHVLEIMRWVLFRTEDEPGARAHDQIRFTAYLKEADDGTRRLLEIVTKATLDGTPLKVRDLADMLDEAGATTREAIVRIQEEALDGRREPLEVWAEESVGLEGKKGMRTFVAIRSDLAKVVTAHTSASGG